MLRTGVELIHTGAEFGRLASNGTFKSRITHGTPYLVVHTILQMRRAGMGIKRAPAVDQPFTTIALVFPAGIFEKQKLGGLPNDTTTIGNRKRGGGGKSV